MYEDDILNLIEQSPLEIDTDIQIDGRPPRLPRVSTEHARD
jgi:hypothetical protein